MKNYKKNLVIFAIGFGIGAVMVIWTQVFFKYYLVRSPIVFRSPIVKRDMKPLLQVSPTPRIVPVIKTLSPTPTLTKKRTFAPVVQASETTLKTIDQEIVEYIKSKDWDDSIAIRLAKSENFWNLTKSFNCSRTGGMNNNGTRDHGLWQINDIHIKSGAITLEDANDCFKATDFAYGLYKARGNFSAWSAFNNGSYLNHTEDI